MKRMVIVSNRLPITIEQQDGGYRALPSCGGLVTALRPIVSSQPAVWIGWPGTDSQAEVLTAIERLNSPLSLVPVFLSESEKQDYYIGFANEILWPLFHDLQSRCCFLPRYWDAYESVNSKFAASVVRHAGAGDQIWIHDYHLMLVAEKVQRLRAGLRLSYFHHIPFPPPEIFNKLPARDELLSALLKFDRVGFQTRRDRRNFISCVRDRIPGIRLRRAEGDLVRVEGNHFTEVGVFPISIDFDEFANQAVDPRVLAQCESIRSHLPEFVLLGVDRLDYTKGLPDRLRAYRLFLKRNPEFHRRVVLVQVTVPSREQIPSYLETRTTVERLISEINGEFGAAQWMPIHYVHRSLTRLELLAHYRAANVMLVTSLKDGMNLVAKEFCAARTDERGVLLLSEFAGAACELGKHAMVVNPCDADRTANSIEQSLRMTSTEQARRMRMLRQQVKRHGVQRWCRNVWEGSDTHPSYYDSNDFRDVLAAAGD